MKEKNEKDGRKVNPTHFLNYVPKYMAISRYAKSLAEL